MIGNDIVDLAFARSSSNWQRPRWLQKLFSPAEQKFILAQKNPERYIWLYWSMKESAYKVLVQQEKQRFFAPKKLQCIIQQQDEDRCRGQVSYQSKLMTTQSRWNEDFIHSLAYPADQTTSMTSDIFLQPKSADRYWMYQKLSAELAARARFSGVAQQAPRIKKNKLGIPRIICAETQQSISLSISHHGSYGAFAIVESTK